MEKNKPVFTVAFADGKSNSEYVDFVEKLVPLYKVEIYNSKLHNTINLAVFTGGADVNPEIYGQLIGKNTFCDNKLDDIEISFYNSLPYYVPKLGICRGMQLLSVLQGHSLIQHVEGHKNTTDLITIVATNDEISLPGDHHQMVLLNPIHKCELIGYSTYFKSNIYLNGDNNHIEIPDDFLEPEIVYFPSGNILGIQAHPEWIDSQNELNTESLNIIINLIRNKLNLNKYN